MQRGLIRFCRVQRGPQQSALLLLRRQLRRAPEGRGAQSDAPSVWKDHPGQSGDGGDRLGDLRAARGEGDRAEAVRGVHQRPR